MIPTKDQIDTYFKHVDKNYDNLIRLLDEADSDLTKIFAAMDKPVPATDSLGGMLLEATLGLAFPEANAFFSFANHMIEGAKKMKEKVEEMRRYTELVNKIVDTKDAADKVNTTYENAPMNMIKTLNGIRDQLINQQTLAEKLSDAFVLLRGVKTAEPFFNSIQWATPPALVGGKSAEIRYIFTYILARLSVFRFVRLNLHSQSNPFGLGLTELLVTKIEPVGIKETGCQYIFDNFNRSFPDSKNSGAVLPARNIVAIRNYYDMIDNWYPDINISDGTHEEQVAVMGDPRRRHFTPKMLMIANGFKRVIPEVVMTPEFRLN
jgi:hypothetical protein